jgi:hypothetical protein
MNGQDMAGALYGQTDRRAGLLKYDGNNWTLAGSTGAQCSASYLHIQSEA